MSGWTLAAGQARGSGERLFYNPPLCRLLAVAVGPAPEGAAERRAGRCRQGDPGGSGCGPARASLPAQLLACGLRAIPPSQQIGHMVQFFIDNLLLIAVAFISGAMLVWPLVRARASGPTLSTLQATQLINARNPQIVDLRSAEDFAKGSLPNARSVPAATVGARAGELKKDKPVLLVCATGTSAGRTAALLRSQGFSEVFVLAGGIAGWREAGLPLRS
jgi:rhodanese-related sulfurtransferase